MGLTTTTKMDRVGRLVLPKAIRLACGLKPGMPLTISVHDGRVEIEPQAREIRIVRKGGLLVAEPTENSEPMTNEAVQAVVDSLRSSAAIRVP